MASIIEKYQPDRQDILWNTDWGIPKDSPSAPEGEAQGLVLFKDRWISRSEHEILSGQERAYKNIRFVEKIFTVLAYLMLPYCYTTAKSLRTFTGGLYGATGWLAFMLICGFVAATVEISSGKEVVPILLGLGFGLSWCGLAIYKLWSVSWVRTILTPVQEVSPNGQPATNESPEETSPASTHNVSAVPANDPPPQPDVNAPQKTKINAKAVVQDIRNGMGDVGLMQKYGLSAKQLTTLYKKLEEAGLTNKA